MINKLDSKAPEGAKQDASVMTLDVQIENTEMQKLETLRPFYTASDSIPTTLMPEAQIVLQALFACFERHKVVKEGLLKDLVWGFEQMGIPGPLTMKGLGALEKEGYIKLRAPDNSEGRLEGSFILDNWVVYTKKILELVYERPTC